MAHQINKHFISKGHHARVLLKQAIKYGIKSPYEWEGVTVFPPIRNEFDLFRNCNVVFTHLEYTQDAIANGKKARKPVVHFIHNDTPYQSIKDNPGVFVVYNSEWIKNKLGYPNKSFVMPPPCDYRYYKVTDNPEGNEFITLINLDWNKGGEVLQKLAERLPNKKFLAVVGSYNYDERGQFTNQPKNVTVIPNTPNILDVYRKTRVLIMPSFYESWGRTASEAMCSGIPVVCSKTPGLFENCGKAGLYVEDRDNIDDWVKWIEKLDDKKFYSKQSRLATDRSIELDPVAKLEQFEKWIYSLI